MFSSVLMIGKSGQDIVRLKTGFDSSLSKSVNCVVVFSIARLALTYQASITWLVFLDPILSVQLKRSSFLGVIMNSTVGGKSAIFIGLHLPET